jgi:glutaconate CoA-transferase subunit B
MDYTPDELMVVCMARQVRDGEIVIQGLATPMVAAAYLLARSTHAPNLYFASAIGQGVCQKPAPLGLTNVESLWLDQSLVCVGFVRAVLDVLPSVRPMEYFRPAQVDPCGNTNNIAFGKDFLGNGRSHPLQRLPGSGGIPDVTTFLSDIYLYVPRHSRVTFVPKLDVHSGLGHSPSRTHGQGPRYLVTNLGEFDFMNGRMRLTSFHQGVSLDKIKAQTGFELEIAPDIHPTIPPSPEEIRLLRQEIDPLGIRRLEMLSGTARHQHLRYILEKERV